MKTNELMCRAKKYGTNEWVCGYYLKCNYYLDEDDIDIIVSPSATLYPRNEFDGLHIVDPITVCRYTGLKDKNGTSIFEHDYVRTEYGRICEVTWFLSSVHCGWDFMPVAKFDCPPPHGYSIWSADNLEIVGNKFDNAEIAEVLT